MDTGTLSSSASTYMSTCICPCTGSGLTRLERILRHTHTAALRHDSSHYCVRHSEKDVHSTAVEPATMIDRDGVGLPCVLLLARSTIQSANRSPSARVSLSSQPAIMDSRKPERTVMPPLSYDVESPTATNAGPSAYDGPGRVYADEYSKDAEGPCRPVPRALNGQV